MNRILDNNFETSPQSSYYIRKYLWGIFLIVSLLVFSVFWGFSYRSSTLIKDQLLKQGQSFFDEIIVTREWAANHGGVYIKMGPDTTVNPYLLKIPNLNVVIKDEYGIAYTLKNPALMTREISEIADKKRIFKFKITSLNPLNPKNKPDKFERDALQLFDQGKDEYFTFEKENEEIVNFRYMAPLITEKPCLKCHGQQGYQEGDIRGGISVSLPATAILKQTTEDRNTIILIAVGIVGLLFVSIRHVAQVFIADMSRAEQQLRKVASHDYLTNLLNRREAIHQVTKEIARSYRTGKTIAFILCDIDHFKVINDTYGHNAGDFVLKKLAHVLTTTLRDYDIACRYGGEEFLLVAPETSIEQALLLAERLRTAISSEKFVFETQEIFVAVSIGVTQLKEDDTIEKVLSRADSALYQAKTDGRNRSCLAE